MDRRLANLIRSAIYASALGLVSLAGSATTASAHYLTTRCDRDGDRCWVLRCDDDGDDCYRVRAYERDADRWYSRPRGHWACDEDGYDCRWVEERQYRRPNYALTFGWDD